MFVECPALGNRPAVRHRTPWNRLHWTAHVEISV